MFPPVKKPPRDQRRLLELFSDLDDQDKASLTSFAEFLAQRQKEDPASAQPPPEPEDIVRPEKESVVAAIKRLSKTYYMLDTQRIFNETASLMTAHVMQGRPAAEVIDELELLFEQQYRVFRTSGGE